jgi:hypothetical protein
VLLKYRTCCVNKRLTVLHEWPVFSLVNTRKQSEPPSWPIKSKSGCLIERCS